MTITYILFLFLFYFELIGSWSEDVLMEFRKLQYSVNFFTKFVEDKKPTEPYEYILVKKNRYLCKFDLLKKYTELESRFTELAKPDVNISELAEYNSNYDDFLASLSNLKNICVMAIVMDSNDYIYQLCFYGNLTRFKYTDSYFMDTQSIGTYSSEQFWTTEQLNMENMKLDSLIYNEGAHTQTYISSQPCSTSSHKTLQYVTKLKFYCDPKVAFAKVVEVLEVSQCDIEISVNTKFTCDFKLFNENYRSTKKKANIDCYPIAPKKYGKELMNRQNIHVNSELENYVKPLIGLEKPLLVPTYFRMRGENNFGNYIHNTKFLMVAKKTDNNMYIISETNDYNTNIIQQKLFMHKVLDSSLNSDVGETLIKQEKLVELDKLNFTEILEHSYGGDNNIALKISLESDFVSDVLSDENHLDDYKTLDEQVGNHRTTFKP